MYLFYITMFQTHQQNNLSEFDLSFIVLFLETSNFLDSQHCMILNFLLGFCLTFNFESNRDIGLHEQIFEQFFPRKNLSEKRLKNFMGIFENNSCLGRVYERIGETEKIVQGEVKSISKPLLGDSYFGKYVSLPFEWVFYFSIAFFTITFLAGK